MEDLQQISTYMELAQTQQPTENNQKVIKEF